MRTFVLFTILCACMIAWGADQNPVHKVQLSFYELKIDSMNSLIAPKWMDELTLADSALLVRNNNQMKVHRTAAPTTMMAGSQQIVLKRSAIGAIANAATDYLGELPSDSVYMPPEEEGAESDNGQNARQEAEKKNSHNNLIGTIANTGQLGDAPSDDAYQGGSGSGSTSNVGSAVQQATEDAKKKQAHANMMGTVANGGQWDDNSGENYQTDIQPAKKAVNVGEDRIPYLVKQLSSPQNPNKNPADIQRDIRRQMMMQQTAQPNPYDDL